MVSPRRFGLRARVITAFGIGALLLSALLSVVTYQLTRGNLLEQRREEVFANTVTNARGLDNRLGDTTEADDLTRLLNLFATPEGSQQGLLVQNSFTLEDPLLFVEEQLHPDFRDRLLAGEANQMIFDVDGEPFYAVGIPLPTAGENAAYMQAAPFGELEDTLNSLLFTLLGASAVTTILGLGFGVYVAARIFSPIGEISFAAEQIAGGDLSTRLGDVTDPDLDKLVRSFNDMTATLQARIERDARFASDVSHELRSPLMTLTGSVALLEHRRDEMPERAQIALDLLSTDIRRFALLVEDLLEISRFDVGAVELDLEEVMLYEFVRQAIAAATGGAREIPIRADERTAHTFVEIDKRRIAQAIRNLSENADKYAGGITQVRLTRSNGDVRIELEDEGPGVPVEERERVFERFARGTEGGRRGSGTGVGLGLSLVTEHLNLHGGSISVCDRFDGLFGARFVLDLPGVVIE